MTFDLTLSTDTNQAIGMLLEPGPARGSVNKAIPAARSSTAVDAQLNRYKRSSISFLKTVASAARGFFTSTTTKAKRSMRHCRGAVFHHLLQ